MYSVGQQKALSAFGLTKHAWSLPSMRQVASGGRSLLAGAPGTWAALKRQAGAGTLFAPHNGNPLQQGLYHKPFDWLVPRFDFGRKGMSFGQRAARTAETALSLLNPLTTAYSGYQVLSAPPEQRGEAVGRFAGNLLGGTVGGPFGLVGQMGGSMLGEAAGGFIGKQIGNAALNTPRPVPPSPPPDAF